MLPIFLIGIVTRAHGQCGTSRRQVVGDPPVQFSQEEWDIAANVARDVAEENRMVAEHVHAESLRVFDETREIADQAESDLQRRFSERLTDIRHWVGELKRKFAEIDDEVEIQVFYRRRLELLLGQMCHILQIDQATMNLR